MMSDLRNIARELAGLKRQVRHLSQPQLAHSSFEGAIEVYDDDGLKQIIGQQYDGSYSAAPVAGPTPAAPSAPILATGLRSLRIRWDGAFANGSVAPMDFARVSIHISQDPTLDALADPTIQFGTIESPRGGEITTDLEPGTYYVTLVTWTRSGKPSTQSAVASAEVSTLVAADIAEGIFAAERLGAGVPDATKVLWGDGWRSAPSGGGGGGGGLLLLEYTPDPDAAVPVGTAAGTVVFMKAQVAETFTWDFRNLSALPAGWTRRGGLSSETFGPAGMAASYAAGQAHIYTLSGLEMGGTLEAKVAVKPAAGGNMLGPAVAKVGGRGAMTFYYSGSSAYDVDSFSSTWAYDTNAGVIGSSAQLQPGWMRIRYAGSAGVYGSFSADGVAWSTELNFAAGVPATGIDQIGLGSIYGTGSITWEYAKWTSGSGAGVGGGLLGWWDGAAIVPF